MSVIPVNRMLLLHPAEEDAEGEANILLPDDYKARSPYGSATVLAVASDCKVEVSGGDDIVFDNSMLQEVNVNGETHYLLLENYVMCVVGNI